MNWANLTAILTGAGIVAVTAAYIFNTFREKYGKEQLAVQNLNDETIGRLNNAISALERENTTLKDDNLRLDRELTKAKADILAIETRITNKTAIDQLAVEVRILSENNKAILEQLKIIGDKIQT